MKYKILKTSSIVYDNTLSDIVLNRNKKKFNTVYDVYVLLYNNIFYFYCILYIMFNKYIIFIYFFGLSIDYEGH